MKGLTIVLVLCLIWLLIKPYVVRSNPPVETTRYCPSQSLGGLFVPCRYVRMKETAV